MAIQTEGGLMVQKPDGIFGVFDVVRDFYAHGIDEHLWVFLLMVIIACDIVVGVSRAWAYHEFSSSKFRKGLVSHTAMITFVAIFYPFAAFMNLGGVLDTFILAMMAAYGSSILASLSALGVEIPYFDKYIKKNIDKDKFVLTSQNEEEEEEGENKNEN
jgi:toxin secretion/phage lysis holin